MIASSRKKFTRQCHPLAFASYLQLYGLTTIDFSQQLLGDLSYGPGNDALYGVGLRSVLDFKPNTRWSRRTAQAWWQAPDPNWWLI